MRTICTAAVVAALTALATSAAAQDQVAATPAVGAAPAPVAASLAPAVSAAEARVPVGTKVIIAVGELVSTKTHKKGDWFNLALSAPIKLDGDVVIPAGVLGKGQVVDSGRSGIGGKPAKLVLAARYIEHEGRRIPLKALKLGATGDDNTDEAMLVSSLPYVGVVGIFVKGGEIDITPGTHGWAKLAEDYVPGAAPAAPAAAAPAPTPPAAAAAAPVTSLSANQP